MKINLLFFGIILLLTSCDPARAIEFINKTDSPADVTIVLDTNSVYYKQQRFEMETMSETDSIIFTIEANTVKEFYLGMGNWSDKELELLASSIKQLDIITKDKSISYDSSESLYELFRSSQTKLGVQVKIE